jgi:hypothetical protein
LIRQVGASGMTSHDTECTRDHVGTILLSVIVSAIAAMRR